MWKHSRRSERYSVDGLLVLSSVREVTLDTAPKRSLVDCIYITDSIHRTYINVGKAVAIKYLEAIYNIT